jgi:hypothetical protein
MRGVNNNNGRHALAGHAYGLTADRLSAWGTIMMTSGRSLTGKGDTGRDVGAGKGAYTAAAIGKVEAGISAIQEMCYLAWGQFFTGFFRCHQGVGTIRAVTPDGTCQVLVWDVDGRLLQLPRTSTAKVILVAVETLLDGDMSLRGMNAPKYGIDGWTLPEVFLYPE